MSVEVTGSPLLQVEARLHLGGNEDGSSALEKLSEDVYGPLSGQVTSVAKQVFRRALLEAGPRLVEAMFLCEISTTSEALSGQVQKSPFMDCQCKGGQNQASMQDIRSILIIMQAAFCLLASPKLS